MGLRQRYKNRDPDYKVKKLARQLQRKVNLTSPKQLGTGIHILYKITVGKYEYIGYTSRPMEDRLKEHIRSARKKSGYKLHWVLKEHNFEYTVEQIFETHDEIICLVEEINHIKLSRGKLNNLNVSYGGEGSNYKVELINGIVSVKRKYI